MAEYDNSNSVPSYQNAKPYPIDNFINPKSIRPKESPSTVIGGNQVDKNPKLKTEPRTYEDYSNNLEYQIALIIAKRKGV